MLKEFNYSGENKKLSKFVCNNIPSLNFYKFKSIIRKGDIKINGKKTYDDVYISDGDNVKVYYTETPFAPIIAYEDDNVIVFDKPIKIASEGKDSFAEKVKKNINDNYILIHRLDTNTRGLLMFAKNQDVFERFVKAFRNHEIRKRYLACVYGELKNAVTYTEYLSKDSVNSLVKLYKTPVQGTEKAVTVVNPLLYRNGVTYVDVEPVTGRTHQIRAHLAYHGYPIIGDGKYGKKEVNNRFSAANQMLMSCYLAFELTDEKLQYLNKVTITLNTKDFYKI